MQREGILSWAITRRQVSRDLWLLRPSPVIAHWVSYQQKPSSELGTSLPSNTEQNGHEMPAKVWSELWPQGGCVNYRLALAKSTARDQTTEAFAICLYGDRTLRCYSCCPSVIPEGAQGAVRCSVLRGIWWDGSLDSWMFLGTDFMISIPVSPHIWRSTKSLHGDIRSSWLTKKPFVKRAFHGSHGAELPFTKTICIDPPPLSLWSSLSELSETQPPRLQSFCPIQLNSQLSSCTS